MFSILLLYSTVYSYPLFKISTLNNLDHILVNVIPIPFFPAVMFYLVSSKLLEHLNSENNRFGISSFIGIIDFPLFIMLIDPVFVSYSILIWVQVLSFIEWSLAFINASSNNFNNPGLYVTYYFHIILSFSNMNWSFV